MYGALVWSATEKWLKLLQMIYVWIEIIFLNFQLFIARNDSEFGGEWSVG